MHILMINPRPAGSGLNEATVEPPLGIGYIAAVLENNGFACGLLDANALRLTEQEVLRSIPGDVRALGIYLNSFSFSSVQSLARAVKRLSRNICILLGGPLPSAAPEMVLREFACDGVVIGEGEYAVLSVMQNIASGRQPFYGDIPGISWLNSEGEMVCRPGKRIVDLDALPFPAFHLMPPLTTYRTRKRKSPAAPIITSRGCSFGCSFCSKDVFLRTVTYRSAENVLAEIDFLVKRYGVRQIDILDDNFALDRVRLERIMDGIIAADYCLAINMQTGIRTELLDEQLLKKMRKAGVFKLAFGIESADERVLALNHKIIDLAKVEETVRKAKGLGFIVYGFFIIGLPGETNEGFEKTLSFAKRARFDVANFCVAIPFIGTELFAMIEKQGRFLIDTRKGIESGFYDGKVFFEYEGFNKEEIMQRYKRAYSEFYSPWKMMNMLAGVRSLHEFFWLGRAFLSVIKGLTTKADSRVINNGDVTVPCDRITPHAERVERRRTYYHDQLTKIVRRIVPDKRRVLDLGCGTGDILGLLKPAYGVGVDISASAIEIAKQRYPELQWKVADIESMDNDEGIFDYILLINTIGFLNDIQAVFHSMRKYTGPHTRIVIVHYNYLWEPLIKMAERLGIKQRQPNLSWLSLADIENLLLIEDYDSAYKDQHVLMPVRFPLIAGLFNNYLVRLPLLWRCGLVETVVARPMPHGSETTAFSCTIVVPARNERGTIEPLIRMMPEIGSHTEIIFVEGHSTDGTLEEIYRVRTLFPGRDIKVFKQEGDGKADAVRKGLSHATGDILMILDGDMTVDPRDLMKFYKAVASGKGELVIGSRLVYQLREESMRFFNLIGNKLFSMFFTYILGQRIKDTLCGTKAFTRQNYQSMMECRSYFGDIDPFGDFDLIFGAVKANLKIVEIPVRYYARRYGTTQIRRFRHGFLLLKMVCIAIRKLKFA